MKIFCFFTSKTGTKRHALPSSFIAYSYLAKVILLAMFFEGVVAASSVTVSPTAVTLNPSQIKSFTASVTGILNTKVTWSLDPAIGTVSTSGNISVYTAPAIITSPETITITATSVSNSTNKASALISLNPNPTLSITPLSATLSSSQSVAFSMGGSNTSGVLWSFSPSIGSLIQTGSTAVYTAPSSLSQNQTIQIQVASVSNSNLIAKAVLLLHPTVALSMTPSSVNLNAAQTQLFTASVSGTTNTAVTWSLSPPIGALSTSGANAVYQAPSTITGAQTVAIMATSAADLTKSMQSLVQLVPLVVLTLAPDKTSLSAGQTQQFTATVSGATNQQVNWSLNPSVGSISSTGLYTAPVLLTQAQTVSVTATSVADPTKTQRSSVTLILQLPRLCTVVSRMPQHHARAQTTQF